MASQMVALKSKPALNLKKYNKRNLIHIVNTYGDIHSNQLQQAARLALGAVHIWVKFLSLHIVHKKIIFFCGFGDTKMGELRKWYDEKQHTYLEYFFT